MKNIIENTKELQDAIFEILKAWDAVDRAYWPGYGQLNEELQEIYSFKVIGLQLCKKALQSLKAEGKVITMPLFRESDGLLSGTGWFFNYYEIKNELANNDFYRDRGMPGIE